MIRRLLIANRGEIAVRIARACREMGVETVAVYSEADARAAHVAAADRTLAIGPARSADSYLNTNVILDAARRSDADAIHPGYGFLSENAAFAAACEAAGLVFVGPPADVIRRMGSKIEARRTMVAAGVPVVPGDTPTDQTDAGLRRAVDRVGLPALIKASSGGGGKGMRRVSVPDEILDAVVGARREAEAAFGDGTLYVERLFERPYHVEVQIFGDAHGQLVHLFERDCSVQRRHQKVIEETPSPLVAAVGGDLGARIRTAAVLAARAVSYRNAGTVEFLVTREGTSSEFYFLEMNTRLQVEHGVTELVAGVDLVHAQLLVASGQPLPWNQGQISSRGHAIEARVYAEDPAQGFLPQSGPLLLYREPVLPGVRIDSGVREGDNVPVHYDPLIAKVMAVAESRVLAVARLRAALEQFPILGIRTNISFLLQVLAHPDFEAGRVDTGFLDRHTASLTQGGMPPPLVLAAMDAHRDGSLAAAPQGMSSTNDETRQGLATPDPWNLFRGWRG
jgi:acetyl/propionyl-CoA carboxylase alpha subunit